MRLCIRWVSRNYVVSTLSAFTINTTYLPDDLGRLGGVDRPDILHHGAVEIGLVVEMITEFAVNLTLLIGIKAGFLCQVYSQGIQVPLVQHIKSLLESLFVVSVDLQMVNPVRS